MSSTQTTITAKSEAGLYNVNASERERQLKAAEALSFGPLVAEVRASFLSGKTKDLAWRRSQLNALMSLIKENHELIAQALAKDHGGPKVRAAFDLTAYGAAEFALAHLEQWAGPQVVKHNSLVGKSYIRKEPKGVVLIIAPWNYPFSMVFDPLVAVLAAGNCAVIKPSEVSTASCELLAALIPKYFDNSCIKVITGGVPETTALLREKFDHIMYTGNGAVGRIVMQAAAKHLTPVTLELGGKSPVYVDSSAKVSTAVQRINAAKWVNVGQTCIAPDYILVHEKVAKEFKDQLVKAVKKGYGESMEKRQGSKDWGKVIAGGHVDRISNLVSGTKGTVLVGGKCEKDARFFDPTVIDEPSLDDKILQEEIFGPVLPIVTVKSVQEAAEKVNLICDKPLALYIFAQDQKAIDYFLNHTNSGGVCVNSALEHIVNPELPFGGVGESGIGAYHGKFGFDEFSHFRSVYVKDTMFIKGAYIPPPPYKDSLYDLIVKLTITGFLTENQKKALKAAAVAAIAAVGYKVFKSKL